MYNMVKMVMKFMLSDLGLVLLMLSACCFVFYAVADMCYETLDVRLWHVVIMLACASFILAVLLAVVYGLMVASLRKFYKSAIHRTLKYDKKEHTWIKNIN